MKYKGFKEKDLVDEIGRGVLTKTCKICGAYILDLTTHLKWHNALDQRLRDI